MLTGNSGSCGRLPSLLDDWPSLMGQFSNPRLVARKSSQQHNAGFGVDILELKDRFIFRADAPGMSREQMDISIEDSTITLRIERKLVELNEEEGRYLKQERQSGTCSRRFVLPENADADSISAVLKDGVLEIEILKKPEQKPKTVEIK